MKYVSSSGEFVSVFLFPMVPGTPHEHLFIDFSRGYVLEVFGSHFELPDLGPIGKLSR